MEIDTSVPHPARVYDYFIGGKDNYAPDRALAEAMAAALPGLPEMTRANRAFLGRAVRHIVDELDVRQFLDVGSGIPTARNTHQVAQEIDPAARVVYVDNDPIVLAHSRALLASSPQGRTAFVAADARDPQAILDDPALAATLDRDAPVAVMLISVLMYFSDDEARHIVDTLLGGLPAGSVLIISHPTGDFDPDATARAVAVAARGGLTYHARTEAQVTALFDGRDLVAPGVVPLLQWHPETEPEDPRGVHYRVGMART